MCHTQTSSFLVFFQSNKENVVFTPVIGRASRVGGEPGITKAVLTRIQVGVENMCACVSV